MFCKRMALGSLIWAAYIVFFGATLYGGEQKKEGRITWNFEGVAPNQIPDGWEIEATNQKGALATWQVIADISAPSGKNVLALTDAKEGSGSTFNLCWTDSISFLNGEIDVSFKTNTGKEDQGGGVIWRVRDKDNYYVARFNPLEDNLRLYYVKNGSRKMLASGSMKLASGEWHRLKIIQSGEAIEGYLDDRKLMEVKDKTLLERGGVGLWTKADAATSFDDFQVTPLAD
jgi:hypothetical protein